MIRCLHLADLHLGWVPDLPPDKRDIRQKERDSLLKRAIDYALAPDSGINMVVIAGDLFESHAPDASLVEEVLRQLRRLMQARILLVTVPGNHDEITYHDSVYRVRGDSWPGVLVRNPMPDKVCSADIDGTHLVIYSLAYTGGLTHTDRLADLPRAADPGLHMGIFHGSLDWNAGDRSLPMMSSALARAGYDYVALGHIHKHIKANIGKGIAVYPGAIEYKGLSDPGVGHLTIAQFDGGFVTIQTPKIAVRKHIEETIDVSAMRSQNELIEALTHMGDPEALARIILTGAPPFSIDVETLTAAIEDKFFYLEVDDQTDFLTPALIKEYSEEITIRGYFARRLLDRINKAADDRERRLLQLALRKGLAAFQGGGRAR